MAEQDTKRIGGWIQTFGGKQFWPLDPQPEDFCIEDIAQALSNVCRFGGHCRSFYSVAQHSVLVAHMAEKEAASRGLIAKRFALAGLLHDAAEAYVGDMVRPLKYEIPAFRALEKRLEECIAVRFGVLFPIPPIVKTADEILLATECRDLMGTPPAKWTLDAKPADNLKIVPLPPVLARELFLACFKDITA